MPRIEFTVDSNVPPDRVLAAAADFSERRPDLWPNISRRRYTVHERGDTWAEVTEGSDVMGGIWARERYDWSTPGIVTIRCLESPFFGAGATTTWRVSPTASGCHVEVDLHRIARSPRGFLVGALVQLMGKQRFAAELRTALARLATEAAAR